MKKILIVLVVFVVAVIIVFQVAGNMLLAKTLEIAIGTPVKVSRFQLNPFEGKIGVFGLIIKNPAGFQEPKLASLPEIFVNLNTKALFQGRVHVREVRLNLDEITVERNTQGSINVTEIGAVKDAKAAPGEKQPTKEPTTPSEGGPAIAVQIDRVVLSLGRVRYVDYTKGEPTVREFPLEIQNKVIENVTDPKKITTTIVFETLRKVGMNAMVPDFSQMSAGFETEAKTKIDEAKKALGDLGEKMKLPFGSQAAAAK